MMHVVTTRARQGKVARWMPGNLPIPRPDETTSAGIHNALQGHWNCTEAD